MPAVGNYYLQGGPCDGKTGPLTVAETDSGTITCKGSIYKNTASKRRPNGDLIFYYSGPVPTAGGAVKAARLHQGWQDIRHSVNTVMPAALSRSQRHLNVGARAVARARRVRL